MMFAFGTKGETLARLKPLVRLPQLCDQMFFRVSEWREERETTLNSILDYFGDQRLIVRSSASGEDGEHTSMAGRYLSVNGLSPRANVVAEAVDRVIESYGETREGDQVLVQPQVDRVLISGVVMTRDLDTGGPYYVINYDDRGGRTDTVTGGAESKTVLSHRDRPEALRSARLRALIDAVAEIEKATGQRELDIEFCINDRDEIYILQVRPMAAKRHWEAAPDRMVDDALDQVRAYLRQLIAPTKDEHVLGDTCVLGEMTDWNPAEMIGKTPKPLALSLYRQLITHKSWAAARAKMGYRDMVGRPLMVTLAGRPFIDVRLSLNSFLPATLDDGIAERIVSGQLRRLAEHREFHDKIEFNVAITCLGFDFGRRKKELRESGLQKGQIAHFREHLGTLTRDLVAKGAAGGLQELFESTARLAVSQRKASAMPPQAAARELLESCIPHGILPFAALARHAFIGVSLLNSLRDRDAISDEERDGFMRSIHTISADIVSGMHAISIGQTDQETFLARYGHLRPGTYDILSARYDESPEHYFGHAVQAPPEQAPFEPSAALRRAMPYLLRETELDLSVEAFFDYIATAVRLREQTKFEFTRNISDALAAIDAWGESLGLTRADLAFLPIQSILDVPDKGRLSDEIAAAQETYRVTRMIRLPHLISSPDDIDVIRLPLGQPTYITRKTVVAPISYLDSNDHVGIEGRIVFIESADPGFDWIFSHGIAGLVTKYGGANSHMAIRCAEFGLPAAIGCDERLFETLAKSGVIELNCGARTIRAVSG